MFIPSKVQFPIQADKTIQYKEKKFCYKCYWMFDKKLAPDDVLANTHRLYKDKEDWHLELVCEECHRWRLFDYAILYEKYRYLETKTAEEWKRIKKELYTIYEKNIAKFLYKRMRQDRYIRMIEYNWERYFSGKEQQWLSSKIKELTDGCDFVDNIRVAQKGKSRQIKRYWKQAALGCCGSIDTEVEYNSLFGKNKTYRIGFNYGH